VVEAVDVGPRPPEVEGPDGVVAFQQARLEE
jgi:hypothetical protein